VLKQSNPPKPTQGSAQTARHRKTIPTLPRKTGSLRKKRKELPKPNGRTKKKTAGFQKWTWRRWEIQMQKTRMIWFGNTITP